MKDALSSLKAGTFRRSHARAVVSIREWKNGRACVVLVTGCPGDVTGGLCTYLTFGLLSVQSRGPL